MSILFLETANHLKSKRSGSLSWEAWTTWQQITARLPARKPHSGRCVKNAIVGLINQHMAIQWVTVNAHYTKGDGKK